MLVIGDDERTVEGLIMAAINSRVLLIDPLRCRGDAKIVMLAMREGRNLIARAQALVRSLSDVLTADAVLVVVSCAEVTDRRHSRALRALNRVLRRRVCPRSQLSRRVGSCRDRLARSWLDRWNIRVFILGRMVPNGR